MRPVARPAPPLRPRLEALGFLFSPPFDRSSELAMLAAPCVARPPVAPRCAPRRSRAPAVALAALPALGARRMVKKAQVLPAQRVPEHIARPPYVAEPEQVRAGVTS